MDIGKALIPSALMGKRRPFTLIEKRCFFSVATKFKHILENKTYSASVNSKKNEAWDKITEIYNSLPQIDDISSKRQLQHLYKNTKRAANREKKDINSLLENRQPLFESMDSTVTLDGYDPIDKSLLEIVPLPSSSDSDSIIRTIKCEVLEEDHTDNSPCIVSSNSTDSAVISTPSDENVLIKKVFDIIENSSHSTDCDVTSTPPEDIDKKVEEIVKKCLGKTSCPAKPLEEQTICINEEEVQSNNEQASNSHPTSTTAPLRVQLLKSYKKKKREPASMKAAEAIHNQTVTRIKQIEEEHELIKKKLRLEIDSQIESEKRAEAQHKYVMERMKQEDEQSEKLYAAKLRAFQAKARYFENKMNEK